MKLTGSCHCKALRYALDWPGDAGQIPARRCSCTYCSRFDGTWTSHPGASLLIEYFEGVEPGRYRFGTATADFLFCSRCGTIVAALDENSGRCKAVVNVHTLHGDLPSFDRSTSDFNGETIDDRLARRSHNWIGQVLIRAIDGQD